MACRRPFEHLFWPHRLFPGGSSVAVLTPRHNEALDFFGLVMRPACPIFVSLASRARQRPHKLGIAGGNERVQLGHCGAQVGLYIERHGAEHVQVLFVGNVAFLVADGQRVLGLELFDQILVNDDGGAGIAPHLHRSSSL